MKSNNNGFTIVELMIATTVFSTVLLLCTFGLMEIGKTYYKGSTIARTQNVARQIVTTLSEAVQYGSSEPTFTGTPPNEVVASILTASNGVFCIGDSRFTYSSAVANGTSNGLVIDNKPPGSCVASAISNGKQLLGTNMRLTRFQILKNGGNYNIIVKVTYGDTDLINLVDVSQPVYGSCNGGRGSQFCAASQLETTVHRRLSS